MREAKHRDAFTLIEVLIVVVIMAVLAATIIPQFASSTKDAQESTAKFNLHTLKSQIELYKAHHLGSAPALADSTLASLTSASKADGTTGTGDDFPYGPYVDAIPTNPIVGNNTVVGGGGTAVVAGGAGWQYQATTGKVWSNTADGIEAPAGE